MTRTAIPLDDDIQQRSAWTAHSVDESDWRVPVSADCRRELLALIEWRRANPLPVELLDAAGAWDGRMLPDVVDLARQQGLRERGDHARRDVIRCRSARQPPGSARCSRSPRAP